MVQSIEQDDDGGVWFSEYKSGVNENISGACGVKITKGNKSSESQLFLHTAVNLSSKSLHKLSKFSGPSMIL